MHLPNRNDTICALATAPGQAALAVIRVSGPEAIPISGRLFQTMKGRAKDLQKASPYSIHYGKLMDGEDVVDEVLLSIFRSPRSFTGEDVVEISCHGSVYIQQRLLQLLQRSGCRMAEAGEFTLRAFLNGKMDLSQAEAVADLISAEHSGAHKAALQQLRGGYSHTMQALRTRLIDFASLIELELDFAEEDVEFANRDKLQQLVSELLQEVTALQASFASGNVMKQGVPVIIAGKPNVGKSTLLNALLNEERAIVSDIAGTTRDVIEDQMVIDGIRFRFMDTAGIRETEDTIEKIGVERTMAHAAKASILMYLCDPEQSSAEALTAELDHLKQNSGNAQAIVITVINKCDRFDTVNLHRDYGQLPQVVFISAKEGRNIEELKAKLAGAAIGSGAQGDQTLVTSARHAESLHLAGSALQKVIEGIQQQLPTDLLAFELKEAIYHLGNITGEVYTDDLLGNIFSKFCIGK
jgi:tRNA modification GTPase